MVRLFDRGVFFFFFQAEDGIRDLTVTGVQTCALPISATRHSRAWSLTRLCGTRPCKDVSTCFTAGPAGANMQGGVRAFRGGGMSTADRIYQRTEAGEKAWESRHPGVPAEQRRILGPINRRTHTGPPQ